MKVFVSRSVLFWARLTAFSMATVLCAVMSLPARSQDGAQQALGVLVRLEPGDQAVTGTPKVDSRLWMAVHPSTSR